MRIQRPKASSTSDPNLLFVSLSPFYKNEPITFIYPKSNEIRITELISAPAWRETLMGFPLVSRGCVELRKRDRLGSEGWAPIQAQLSSLPAPLIPTQRRLEEAAAVVLWRRQAEVHLALLGFSQHPPQ